MQEYQHCGKEQKAFEVKIDSEFEHFLSRQKCIQGANPINIFYSEIKNSVFNSILKQNTGMLNIVFPCYFQVYVQLLPTPDKYTIKILSF